MPLLTPLECFGVLVGGLCGSAEVLGGFWVGAEKCGRWEAVQVLFACCLLPAACCLTYDFC